MYRVPFVIDVERKFDPKIGWDSSLDDILEGFYKPALENCLQYDRLAGFFASSTFAVALSESLDFIERGGTMRLVTSTEFSEQDLDVITKSVDGMQDALSKKISDVLESDNEVAKISVSIMAYMLENSHNGRPQLAIKIAVPEKRGIFHQKVGILTMENGDMVSFSGSVNETGSAWTNNIEEFKVFRSWGDDTSRGALKLDIEKFERFWNNNAANTTVYELPDAVRMKIVKSKPESTEEYHKLIDQLRRKISGAPASGANHAAITLRDYQKKAISTWMSQKQKGILVMPTGTGKTFTAFGCISALQSRRKRLAVVIVTPYKHLTNQWIENAKSWNDGVLPNQRITQRVIKTIENPKWKKDLGRMVTAFNKKKFSGEYLINDCTIHTSYDTFADPDFIKLVRKIDGDVMLVADEAHHIGALTTRTGLDDKYIFRLALTATPTRYFDIEGSRLIQAYFHESISTILLSAAIENNYLTPYCYYPIFAELNSDELEKYRKLTTRIARKHAARKNKANNENDVSYNAENQRAKLIAVAENKYDKLAEILDKMNNRLDHALIYCHDKKQLKQAGKILSARNINYDMIDSTSKMVERKRSIRSLEDDNHRCIVAMRCLDEGVDIPSARIGIILASTGNTLQYIQRRGRLLRKSPSTNKESADIYDLLVSPPTGLEPGQEEEAYMRKMVAKELLRHMEFASSAKNKDQAVEMIRPTAERFRIDLSQLSVDYVLGL